MDLLKESKPIMTYSGDVRMFEGLQQSLESGLPSEAIEWKRSFGRSSKNVVLEAKFIPFNPKNVSATAALTNLMDQPILHTYWMECPDIDTYKTSTKEELTQWLMVLRQCGITSDWMIILIESSDVFKKANKLLPRTSVIDKLKTDLGGKQPERCIALVDPSRHDSRASESWQTLLHRIRLLMWQAYNKTLGRFEEHMRGQRERRNDPQWNFCEYFLLQEELAFAYEMLGQFDEGLVQYDELDALFTQFVLNSHISESPPWLVNFSGEFNNWSGINLECSKISRRLRSKLAAKNPSLIDVRNYLFSRQGVLLLKLEKPWEVAKRILSFLHNAIQEIQILEVVCPEGSVACWVFLSIMEVLSTCQKVCENSPNVPLAQFWLHTADLWSYARQKLFELGELCGLLPRDEATSSQLHKVVELYSGISDDQELVVRTGEPTAVAKLKEALSSKQAFQKYYLELSETAISTYKHIGRIRSARLVGLDLAKFYLQLGQVHNAVTFLVDALKTFEWQGWNALTVQTLLDVADCYEKLGEVEKLLRVCAMLACSDHLIDNDEKFNFFQKMRQIVDELDQDICTDAEQIFIVRSCRVLPPEDGKQSIIPESEIWLELELESKFPFDLPFDDISISLTHSALTLATGNDTSSEKSRRKVNRVVLHTFAGTGTSGSGIQRTPSNRSTSSVLSSATPSLIQELDDISESGDLSDYGTGSTKQEDENRLRFSEEFDLKQDKSLNGIRVVCRNANRFLRRKDSSGSMLKDGNARRGDFKNAFTDEHDDSLGDRVLKPGSNLILLRAVAGPVGLYTLHQMSIRIFNKRLDFLADLIDYVVFPNTSPEQNRFTVISEPPSLTLTRNVPGTLWAGIEQEMILTIQSGSFTFEQGTEVKVRCSLGLVGRQENSELLSMMNHFVVKLPATKPFETVSLPIRLKADLTQQHAKDGATVEHRLMVEEVWNQDKPEKILFLHFVPPFTVQTRIQTARTKKFLQVSFLAAKVAFSNDGSFSLSHLNLEVTAGRSSKISTAPVHRDETSMALKPHIVCSYIWELLPGPTESEEALRAILSLQFQKSGIVKDVGTFNATFEYKNIQTLYLLSTRIDPATGGELCRASTICSLSIIVEQVHSSCLTSLMYEVLADQAVWAVCGRAAGVINMECAKKQTLVVEVMPLVGGHLQLPHVRLSRYIPATKTPTSPMSTDISPQSLSKDGETSMPRLEPFSSGQIYNTSRTARIHVLPAASSGPALKANPPAISHFHLFQHEHGVSSSEGHASLPY